MRLRLAICVVGAALASASAALASPSIEIRGVAARVTVIPESRSDIAVTISRSDPRLPLRVRKFGDRVYLSGDVARRVHGCRAADGSRSVAIWGQSAIPYEQLPELVVRTPMAVRLTVTDGVFGEIGPSASVDFTNEGCGDWKIADVLGRLHLNQAGAGDLHAGAAGPSDLSVVGSGSVSAGDIRGGLKAVSSSSGDVTVATLSGPFDGRVAGAGNITVTAGSVGAMTIAIAGSGSVTFGGVADSLHATIAGSGGVTVAKVTGPVVRQVFGSGAIRVNRIPPPKRWGQHFAAHARGGHV